MKAVGVGAALGLAACLGGCGVKGPPHPPTLLRPAAAPPSPAASPEPKLEATAVDGGTP